MQLNNPESLQFSPFQQRFVYFYIGERKWIRRQIYWDKIKALNLMHIQLIRKHEKSGNIRPYVQHYLMREGEQNHFHGKSLNLKCWGLFRFWWENTAKNEQQQYMSRKNDLLWIYELCNIKLPVWKIRYIWPEE